MPLDLQYGASGDILPQRTAFDSSVIHYDAMRPCYCAALFDEILRAAGVCRHTRALEIGPGTGQATEPFLDTGCSITAIELGENLAAFMAEKYASRSNLSVLTGDFLDLPDGDTYDLIYSATAFHWIPREKGLAKIHRLLRPGGTLALFWNHPIVGGETGSDAFESVQAVYSAFGLGHSGKKPFDGSSCPAYVRVLEDSGFEDVRCSLHHGYRMLTDAEYVQLMQTYSDHLSLPDAQRIGLEEEMEYAIRTKLGNKLPIHDIMDLYLATKPHTCK